MMWVLGMVDISKVSIVVTAFHRPGYLVECLRGIRNNLPEVEVIVAADDSYESYNAVWESGDAVRRGPFIGNTLYHEWFELPYDSGLTTKRNRGTALVNDIIGPRYTIVASDDYDFSTKDVRKGIESMVATLDEHPDVDLVVGNFDGRRYEGHLTYVLGEYIAETYLDPFKQNPLFYSPCPAWQIDIGVNYFMGRSELFKDVPWDESITPIGGEHGDWFLSLKEARKLVVWTGMRINGIQAENLVTNPKYPQLRKRARETGHKIFMEKRNIKNYYGFTDVKPNV